MQTEKTISKDEWMKRCASRFVEQSNCSQEIARQYAEGAHCDEFADDPETAADEEIACWEGDGSEE